MTEQLGNEQTKELLVGVNELSVEMVRLLKDGAQVSDVGAIIDKMKTDPAFMEKIQKAYDRVNEVPAEVKDLSMAEGVELILVQVQYVPKIIEAAKK